MLYAKYGESRLFLASLNAMQNFVREVCELGLARERWPLRTAYLAAYTCSRIRDHASLKQIGALASQQLTACHQPVTYWDCFCIDYVLAAAGLEDPQVLTTHLDLPGRCGSLAAVRISSLAYFLREGRLLRASAEKVHAASDLPDYSWESANAEALVDLLSGRQPKLQSLCRSLSDAPLELRQYSALDMYLLMRELHPKLQPQPTL